MASKKPPADNERQASSRKSVRTFTDWTYSRLKMAEKTADSGNLYEAATVCEWLLGDPAVFGGLEVRRDALLGLTPTFEPSGDKRRSNKAVKALEAGEDFWASYPESELGQLLMWRLLLGVAPGRTKWSDPLPDHGGRIMPVTEFWHPQGLRYDFQRAGWFGKDAGSSEFPIVPGDGTWLLHALAENRPWALGLWRRLSRPVLLKYLAFQDWSRHSEKAAMLVATSKSDSTKKQRDEMVADLAAAGGDAITALAAGWDLKLVELVANTKQIYEAQILLADSIIAQAIRGGNLSTNVDGQGSRAAAEVQVSAGEVPKIRADGEALATTLHDQSLVWWAEFNFGDPALAPWPVYPTDPPEDNKLEAETAKAASEAVEKFDKLGFDIDVEELKQKFGLTWLGARKAPPVVVQPKPIAPAPGTKPTDPALTARILAMAEETGDSDYRDITEDEFRAILKMFPRVAIAGGGRVGKSTMAALATDRPVLYAKPFEDMEPEVGWSGVSERMVEATKDLESFVIEGVRVAHALRKGMQVDAVVYLRRPKVAASELKPGHTTQAKGVQTVFDEWHPENDHVPVFDESSPHLKLRLQPLLRATEEPLAPPAA
jgi:hypothetical protein